MATTAQIEEAIKSISSKKESLRGAFDLLSFPSPASSLRWEDLEAHISSVESAINARFQELQAKEAGPPPPPEPSEPTPRPELVSLCASMDAEGLRDIITSNWKDRAAIRQEFLPALRSAPDPAKLVLEAIKETFTPKFKADRDWLTCITLLECACVVADAAAIEPSVVEEAKQLAMKWKDKIYESEEEDGLAASAVLDLLLSYGLVSEFEVGEVVDLFVRAPWRTKTLELFQDLGLAEKIPVSYCSKMANFNPLSKLLGENRLTGTNYEDWWLNLNIVLTAEKIAFVLSDSPPSALEHDATEEQRALYFTWHEADELTKCYVLGSMTDMLQKLHGGMKTASDIIFNVKEIFGERSRSARTNAMKKLMTCKMSEGALVRDHVMKMILHVAELKNLGAEIDDQFQVDVILSSLPESYNQFVMNYNVNQKSVTLSELLNMLVSAEKLIKKHKPTTMVAEARSSSEEKPKKKNNKQKHQKPGNLPKEKGKVDVSKGNCHFCGELGHWKRNCHQYLASIKKD